MRRTRTHVRSIVPLTAFALVAGCSTSADDPAFTNPFDPAYGASLPVPTALEARIGDNVVELVWQLSDGQTADEYAVFRRRTDEGNEAERLLERVDVPSYTDTSARNGRTYDYRVAAGRRGRFGERTETIQATPGLLSILISNDDEVTRERDVTVSLSAPGGQSVQLSESSDDFSGSWRPAQGSTSWALSAGDGLKTVYARFRMTDGTVSLPVSDMIRLDTRAVIDSVQFDGSDVREPGDSIHFRIYAGETDGTARITVEGLFDGVALFDDGTDGDLVAGDGVYERDLVVPVQASAFEAEVRASFSDEATNQADPRLAPRLLTALSTLDPVAITDVSIADPPAAPGVTLRWSRSLDEQFSRYRVVRGDASPVDEMDEEMSSITTSSTLQYEDSDVAEGMTYYYRIFVEDQRGRQSGSNEMSVTVPNVRPPAAVSIDSMPATSTDRIGIDWSESDARDFAAYRLYRNETGAVTDEDVLVAEIDDVSLTFADDTGLVENTTYYYRVYTTDTGDLVSRSAEVSATTLNTAPPAVTLDDASDVASTAVTLSWSASDVHDFAAYELYRDEIPTVTRGSTLVVELDDPTFTSFRNQDLESGTQYYYRVFVVDDGEDPAFAGSNTISVTTN